MRTVEASTVNFVTSGSSQLKNGKVKVKINRLFSGDNKYKSWLSSFDYSNREVPALCFQKGRRGICC